QGDQMVYQTEKTRSEMGDKLDSADKSEVESALGKLKTALSGTDTASIKTATEELTQAFYKVSEKLYSQPGAQGGCGDPNCDCDGSGNCDHDHKDGQYYDADYEVVDDDNKKK
ncbi:MAG: Hsp70 family protein, partial [Oscillospiraceae bacterium]|nr:Hsp70 family protein [Oscillospiraceae bacterium]